MTVALYTVIRYISKKESNLFINIIYQDVHSFEYK